jgi:hypothetical protein
MVIKAKEEAAVSDARTLQSYCASSPFAPPPKGAARPRASALASCTPVARRTRAARAARASQSQSDPDPTERPAEVGAAACKPGAVKAGGGHKRKSSECEATNWVDGEAEANRSATRQRLTA